MLTDEFIDVDGLGLADAVGAVHGLVVVLGVPVHVVQDDDVGGYEVYAEAAGFCGEEEQLGGGGATEGGYLGLARGKAGGAVDPAEVVVAECAVILEDVQHGCELAED